MKTETELRDDVVQELRWDPMLRDAKIWVTINAGLATLSGDVASYAQKFAADRMVARVTGVRAVVDDLHVRSHESTAPSDADLTYKVAALLAWNVQVPPTVHATVDDGWVTLMGTAEWQFEREAAARALRDLAGVKGIKNLVALTPRVSAGDVTKRIKAALDRHVELDAKGLQVEAQAGKVTLHGSVRTWSERADAERAAWAAPGVTEVDNQIALAAAVTVNQPV